jgi:hypothetical protein
MWRTYSNPDPLGFREAKPNIKPKMSKRQTEEEDHEKRKVYEKEDRQHKIQNIYQRTRDGYEVQ